MANANARLIACMLEADGREVSFDFGGLKKAGVDVDFEGR